MDIASNAVCTVQVLRQLIEVHVFDKKESKNESWKEEEATPTLLTE